MRRKPRRLRQRRQAPPAAREGLANIGVVEWFRPGEHERVETLARTLAASGISRIRTGVSWADYHTPGGKAWYDWLLPRLAAGFELLPCVTCTPPSLGIERATASPPKRPRDYADFLDLLISRYGRNFEWVELWNEPNNLNDWDWRLDPQWRLFSEMVGAAAYWVKQRGRRTVLGGMCPTDVNWLALMCERDVLRYIDAVGVHAFPGTWTAEWRGWEALIGEVADCLDGFGHEPEIWITEAGYSTWRHDEFQQLERFLELLEAPAARAYWYSLQDLDPAQSSQEGFHFDERHYHTGLLRADGEPKLLLRTLNDGGPAACRRLAGLSAGRSRPGRERLALVTGGCGFIGANLADRLAADGHRVLVYDNLSRPGVALNAAWLKQRHPGFVEIEVADLRDGYRLSHAVGRADRVFHLAAQVAVTTSLRDPLADFEVNAAGTVTLLETLRGMAEPPPLVFASTNKLYGRGLAGEALAEGESRYEPAAPELRHGIGEGFPIELISPYGCSKGVADQYVLDYARAFDLPAVVFRMSCIYGERQFGTEDQGWVAHFLKAALRGETIAVYGDGKQVRDILYIDDAVEAYLLAARRIDALRGHAFNLGGGPENAVSLLEVLALIERLQGAPAQVRFADWRAGDQRYYVSDTRRFSGLTGWRATVGFEEGLARLYRWLGADAGAPQQAAGEERLSA